MAMPRTAENGFDVAFVDRENHAVVLVEVKAHPVERWATILPEQLAKVAERVAFVLAIDPNFIQLYKPRKDSLGEPIVRVGEQSLPGRASSVWRAPLKLIDRGSMPCFVAAWAMILRMCLCRARPLSP
jgi:hypothetical protein